MKKKKAHNKIGGYATIYNVALLYYQDIDINDFVASELK